jgi:hypothetical protein
MASLLAMERAWEDLVLRSPVWAAAGAGEAAGGTGAAFKGRVPPPEDGVAALEGLRAGAALEAVVDGLYVPRLPIPARALVRADDSVFEVMAASILAKTARDRLMELYGGIYGEYGYEVHKGYPTRAHREAVLRWGPSPIQRLSFRVR